MALVEQCAPSEALILLPSDWCGEIERSNKWRTDFYDHMEWDESPKSEKVSLVELYGFAAKRWKSELEQSLKGSGLMSAASVAVGVPVMLSPGRFM